MKFNHLEMKSCLSATPCAANGPQLTMWLMLVMVLSAMFALIHPTHAIAGESGACQATGSNGHGVTYWSLGAPQRAGLRTRRAG